MKRISLVAVLLTAGVAVALAVTAPQPPQPASETAAGTTPASASPAYADAGFSAGEAGLSPAERAGREIWYKATAGNDRFHTYVFQQRVGVMIDWFRVLRSDERERPLSRLGADERPGMLHAGQHPTVPAKSAEETFGFDWCPGDEELLKYVGKTRLSRSGLRLQGRTAGSRGSSCAQKATSASRRAI